jgi:hypothetical protein
MLLGRRMVGLLLSLVPALVPAAADAKPPPAKTTKAVKKAAPAKPRARVEPKGKTAAKQPARTRVESKAKTAKTARTGAKAAVRPKRPNPFLEVPAPGVSETSPAYTYANLSNEDAYSELDRRGIPYRREEPGPDGVRAPIRLTGSLHGVDVHSTLPPAERATTRYEVLDARLALALDDFCALLAEHEIVELVHYTMYRPGAAPRAASDSLPTRHPGGLAIDLGALRRRDGKWLDVREVWRTDIGKKTCGAGAKRHDDARAQELVGLVCDAASRRLFHYVLTPHYDKAHHDHLHLEIKPVVKWFLVN